MTSSSGLLDAVAAKPSQKTQCGVVPRGVCDHHAVSWRDDSYLNRLPCVAGGAPVLFRRTPPLTTE
uniref:Uncharacterized protein n=1 Tax=Anopheles minimus TaxID=112268 RepID=A0A182W9D0_9DIPT